MPRYFFHRADGSTDRDKDGTELPSLDQARKEAVVFAGETLKFKPEILWDGGEFRVEVEDTEGDLLFVLKVSAVDKV